MVLLHSPPPSVSRTRFALQNRNSPLNSESRTWQPAFCFLQRPRSVPDLKPLEPAVGGGAEAPFCFPALGVPCSCSKCRPSVSPRPLFLKRFSCVFGTIWPFLNSDHFKKKNVKNTYQNLPPYPFLSVQSVMSVSIFTLSCTRSETSSCKAETLPIEQ